MNKGSALLVGVLAVPGLQAQTAPESSVRQLVERFQAAEAAFDPGALASLISDKFVEVSPAGEVDPHDRFLGFYTPDKRSAFPPMAVSEVEVRVLGDTAIETEKISFTMKAPDGSSVTRDMRGTFIAMKEGGTWKLVGTQFTGIRPATKAQ